MGSTLYEIGVGAAVAILVLREVFRFLNEREAGSSAGHTLATCAYGEVIMQTKEGVDKLVDMHNVKDKDGTYIWYVKSSLGEAIQNLSVAIDEQNKAFRELAAVMKDRIGASQGM